MTTRRGANDQRGGRSPDQGTLDLQPSQAAAVRARWCRRVLEDDGIEGAGLFAVAWAMAEHVNAETGLAFPSQSSLAREVRLSDRQVRRVLGTLVARRHLVVVGQRPRSRIVEYRLAGPDEPLAELPDAAQAPLFPAIGNRNRKASAAPARAPKAAPEAALSGRLCPDYPDIGVLSPPPTYRTSMSGPSGLWSPDIEPQREPQRIARRGGDVGGRAAADGVSDREDYPVVPAVADDADRRRAVERAWRARLGSEPVLAKPDAFPLHEAAAAAGATPDEVLTALDEAMAKPGFRIVAWAQLGGFVRTVVARRLLQSPKAGGVAPPALRDPAMIRFPGDVWISRAALEAEVAAWRAGRAWDENRLGVPPDERFTDVPPDLRGPRRLAAQA